MSTEKTYRDGLLRAADLALLELRGLRNGGARNAVNRIIDALRTEAQAAARLEAGASFIAFGGIGDEEITCAPPVEGATAQETAQRLCRCGHPDGAHFGCDLRGRCDHRPTSDRATWCTCEAFEAPPSETPGDATCPDCTAQPTTTAGSKEGEGG